MGLYSAGGLIRVTVVDGSAFVGAYAADGSLNVIVSPGTSFVGVIAPCGAMYVTVSPGTSPVGATAPDGSRYVTETPTELSGALRVLVVSGSLDASFSPEDLFDAGQQGAYFDASTGVFEDTAGTTPSIADAVAGRINDLSGNGMNMLQATTAAKPLRKTDGSLWWLETDATDDFMATAASATLGPTPVYMFMAFEKAADASNVLAGLYVNTNDYARITNSTSGRIQGQTRILSLTIAQNLVTTSVSAVPINTKSVAIMRVATGTNGVTINGGSETTAANAWTGSENVASCGMALTASSLTVTSPTAAKFYAFGFIEKALSAGELANLKTWLGSKVGLTL